MGSTIACCHRALADVSQQLGEMRADSRESNREGFPRIAKLRLAIDALQLLANQVAKDLLEEPSRIVIDVAGEMADREASLNRLSERAAGRARETGRSVALDPMNSRDRRIVHMALKEESGLATMSIGEGRYRQVLVVPEGAPEFEEATSSAQ